MPSQTYFEILGVSPTASSGEIREAYLLRSRMFHPDRFDRTRQEQEWNLANELLKDLNQAYAVLRDDRTRRNYADSLRYAGSAPPPRPSAPPPGPSSPPPRASSPPPDSRKYPLGRLCAGFAKFDSLPAEVRTRLTKRAARAEPQQTVIRLQGVLWKYAWAAGCLGWFFMMFQDADGKYWDSDTHAWYLWGSLIVGLILGLCVSWIHRYHESPLKCDFFVTPLYFIKTRFDRVWFWPLGSLKDVSATHNYRNGIFNGTDVNFDFGTGFERLRFRGRDDYDSMRSAFQAFAAKYQAAKSQNDTWYFHSEDDFREYAPATPEVEPSARPSSTTVICCAICLAVAAIYYVQMGAYNLSRHPYPPVVHEPAVIPPSYPTPFSTPVRPPAPPFKEPLVAFPRSGEVRSYTTERALAPLQIKTSSSLYDPTNYLVKLVDAETGRAVLSVFVKGGKTEEINVPLGTYTVKYASGTAWYGYRFLFGPHTAYSKADQTFTFEADSTGYSGYTLTLYPVSNGNLVTQTIEPSEF